MRGGGTGTVGPADAGCLLLLQTAPLTNPVAGIRLFGAGGPPRIWTSLSRLPSSVNSPGSLLAPLNPSSPSPWDVVVVDCCWIGCCGLPTDERLWASLIKTC
jgi:hypothetical protein